MLTINKKNVYSLNIQELIKQVRKMSDSQYKQAMNVNKKEIQKTDRQTPSFLIQEEHRNKK